MQTDAAIITRFFYAVRKLKADKVIRGVATFTTRYGINRRNFLEVEKHPDTRSGTFHVAWIAHLVEDYKVNPSFLLLGNDGFYLQGWSAKSVKAHNLHANKILKIHKQLNTKTL